ncbi:MAG: beta-propeller fold lactonase family protein [Devosia sp.]|nr:beta-propeller fold lactonase family protein [Devosia sp.]
MSNLRLAPRETLLVASRGTGRQHGLWRWTEHGGNWSGAQLATVNQLSALAGHPALPVVYGTSRMGQQGDIHAWRLHGDGAELLGEKSSRGAEPCHLVVDPGGRMLIVTNYTSSTLGVQRLAADGAFEGEIELPPLTGNGVDLDRQDAAHPHQALFADGMLVVIDLGADLLREYAIDPQRRGAAALVPRRETAVPSGTGPRHGVALPDGRFALSGELGSNLVVGRTGAAAGGWANVPSTRRTGPAKTRHLRNYPGDIQCSPDGRFVHFANRGYDTISTFDVAGSMPVMVSELDSGVDWPQHMLVYGDQLLVAGWDSSRVMRMPLRDGRPDQAELVFECAGAGWLMLHREGLAGR